MSACCHPHGYQYLKYKVMPMAKEMYRDDPVKGRPIFITTKEYLRDKLHLEYKLFQFHKKGCSYCQDWQEAEPLSFKLTDRVVQDKYFRKTKLGDE